MRRPQAVHLKHRDIEDMIDIYDIYIYCHCIDMIYDIQLHAAARMASSTGGSGVKALVLSTL